MDDSTLPIHPTAINSINSDDLHSPETTTLSTTPSAPTMLSTISSSYTTPITQVYQRFTPSSDSTIRSTDESTVLYNNVDDFIQEITTQLQLDNKVSGSTIITINNTINVVDEILNWIEDLDNVTLLKKPVISAVITER